MAKDSQGGKQVSPARIVALTGFMGAGKTSIGRALADLLHWSFVDLDQEIELQQKATVREIFQGQGEAQFRESETAALREMLERVPAPGRMVIALGGGTFVQPHNAVLLRNAGARVVFLETPLEEMLERCGIQTPSSADNLRPLAAESGCLSRALRAATPAVPQRRLHGEHSR